MRVLLVTHNALPHHRAGVETYTHQLARQLAGEHTVTVATTRKVISLATGTIRDYEHEGVQTVEVVDNLDGADFASTYRHPTMERAFSAILDRVRPDVVHFQHVLYWSAALPSIAKERGARCVFSLHDYFLMCARMGQLIDHRGASCDGPSPARCAPCLANYSWGQPPSARRWIARLTSIRSVTGIALDAPMRLLERLRAATIGSVVHQVVARAPEATLAAAEQDLWQGAYERRAAAFHALCGAVDAFVTPSRTLAERFVAWGMPAERLHHVPHGLDATPFERVQRRPSPLLRLAFLGTIAPHKGTLDLISAVRLLPADRVQLTVYGRIERRRGYGRRCLEVASGAGNIRFAGWLTRAQVPAAYADIDVLCVPSRWDECAPLTILEAFMAGAPCVVSGRGGLAELVTDGVDGLHAHDADVDDWARVLRRLLDEPGLLDHLRAGIPRVPSVGEHARELVRLYEA